MHYSTLSSVAILIAAANAQPYLSERDADPSFKSAWNTVKSDAKQFGQGFKAGLNSRELLEMQELLEARDPKVNWSGLATKVEKGVGTAVGSLGKAAATAMLLGRNLEARGNGIYKFAKGLGKDIGAYKNGFKDGYSKRDLESRDPKLSMSKIGSGINKVIGGGLKAMGTVDGAAAKAFLGTRDLEDEELYIRDFEDELDARDAKLSLSSVGHGINSAIQAGYKAWGTVDGAATKAFLNGRSIDGEELDARDAAAPHSFYDIPHAVESTYSNQYSNPHVWHRSVDDDEGSLFERDFEGEFEDLDARDAEAGKFSQFATQVEKGVGSFIGGLGRDLVGKKAGLRRREDGSLEADDLYIRALFDDDFFEDEGVMY